mgnify:CR=1 FL=1
MADEVHHYKGQSSDRGIAFARLVASTRWQVGLTGTLYGGPASSIFWLLHRLRLGNVAADYPYNSARQWVEDYGVLEERTYGKGSDDEYGAYSATKRRRTTREKPGVSPAVLHRIIGNTLFLSLNDLGMGLPSYQEEVALIPMGEEFQQEQYTRMESSLRDRAREDSRYLSTWLQWSLGRPNSGFRYEQVIKLHRDDDGNVVCKELLHSLEPVITSTRPLLNKEKWLADYCRAEAAAGRKVLVYVRQTGTRDIQERLENILGETGLRVRVLTSSVGTQEREKWIERYAPGLDVLVVNPRLVETGLDLVQFATVVFYEISYSLYTMWQAMRRVWRLGQTQPVKVVFTAYEGTLEADALSLMGQKMQAAQLLYGDEVGGAIVPEDDGDFLTQLARSVLEGKELPDLQTLFTEIRPSTTSPMGSPTARSPRLRFSQLRDLWLQERENGGRYRRRRKTVPEQQIALALF